MITLWNPTNENFAMQFEGRMYYLKPDERVKVSEPCGKHLLTGFGPRGLTSLEYGDEPRMEQIRADALKLNRDFKLRQVVEYNRRNESRKQMNLAFLIPPEHIREYAKELGIDLLAPYSVREEENARIQQLQDVNEKLSKALDSRDQLLAEQTSSMRAMMERLEKLEKASALAPEPPAERPLKEAKGGKAS